MPVFGVASLTLDEDDDGEEGRLDSIDLLSRLNELTDWSKLKITLTVRKTLARQGGGMVGFSAFGRVSASMSVPLDPHYRTSSLAQHQRISARPFLPAAGLFVQGA